jgi:hypothetical protein
MTEVQLCNTEISAYSLELIKTRQNSELYWFIDLGHLDYLLS